jgi:hypothetical protein
MSDTPEINEPVLSYEEMRAQERTKIYDAMQKSLETLEKIKYPSDRQAVLNFLCAYYGFQISHAQAG